jgi:hypothetical protein
MQTIILKINDEIYDQVLGLLSRFGKDEIEIVVENSTFNDDQKYLEKELNEIISGEAKFLGVEEAEVELEKRIGKHENPV